VVLFLSPNAPGNLMDLHSPLTARALARIQTLFTRYAPHLPPSRLHQAATVALAASRGVLPLLMAAPEQHVPALTRDLHSLLLGYVRPLVSEPGPPQRNVGGRMSRSNVAEGGCTPDEHKRAWPARPIQAVGLFHLDCITTRPVLTGYGSVLALLSVGALLPNEGVQHACIAAWTSAAMPSSVLLAVPFVTLPPAEAGGFSLSRVGVAADQPGP
jgi:hypothetical protein